MAVSSDVQMPHCSSSQLMIKLVLFKVKSIKFRKEYIFTLLSDCILFLTKFRYLFFVPNDKLNFGVRSICPTCSSLVMALHMRIRFLGTEL